MQIRHARRGDEADLAFLLEDHERHYGAELRTGAGAEGAEFLTRGGTLCLVVDDGEKLVGFAILNPYFPRPKLTHGDTRVIWTTGEENKGSQRFYDRLGMRCEKKVYFVMDT